MSTTTNENQTTLIRQEQEAPVTVRQNIQTASPTNSIWQLPLDETAFRHAAVDLALTTSECPWEADIGLPPLPGSPELVDILAGTPPNGLSDEQYNLTLEIEHRLANDFALIAATKEAVFSVTAACIEELVDEHGSLDGLTLRLAANEGISEELKDGLLQIWDSLADQTVSREASTERVFYKIIHLNRLRIFQRVRKAVGHPPIFREKGRTKTNPDDRLFRAFMRMQKTKLTSEGHQFIERGLKLNIALLELLERMSADEAESGTEGVLQELGSISKQCFNVTTDFGRSPFKHVLVDSGLDARLWLKSKYVGEVDKIGAYWRIARSLVQLHGRVSRDRPNNAASLRFAVEGVQPYNSVMNNISIQKRPMKCYVHAEVQLLVHYLHMEARDAPNTTKSYQIKARSPRVIGASKSACFLCFLFLSCHGGLTPPATHGRLYDQWTIPDLAEYTPDQETRLRQTIELMVEAMEKLRTEYRLKRPRDHPMTSRVDIDRVSVLSEASETLAPQVAPRGGPEADKDIRPSHRNESFGKPDIVATVPALIPAIIEPGESSTVNNREEKPEPYSTDDVKSLPCGMRHMAAFLRKLRQNNG